jgi:catechol 2,3-dioxygenase-like lactoylglutathione lyase family enzyme
MSLVDGVSHVATVTDDLDRMIGFYRRVFDAEVVGDVMEEEGLRHAMIRLGPAVALHPFEVPGVRPDSRREMFDRGRLDHFGVTVPDMDTLLEVRARLRSEGEDRTDGEIRDFGAVYSLHYVDPDDVHLEVNLFKDGWDQIDMLERKDWTTIEPEPAR